jgi:uncharacterized membrane protein YhhN
MKSASADFMRKIPCKGRGNRAIREFTLTLRRTSLVTPVIPACGGRGKGPHMINTLIIAGAAGLLIPVLYFEKKENRKGLVPTKGLLSLMFICAALVQPHRFPVYSGFLMAGLGLCFLGDVCLALPQKKAFLFGLMSFLLGHVSYIISFFWVSKVNLWMWAGSGTAVVVSAAVYSWLRPHLDGMRGAVSLYILVITVMVSGSFMVLADVSLGLPGRIMVFTGATSFYFSDIFVARDRFLKKQFVNRLVGLPMYYLGQFLLAFSPGLI